MSKRRKTIQSDPVLRASQDLENWPTQDEDMRAAFEILAQHQERFGTIEFIEHVSGLDGPDDGDIKVIFPQWMTELGTRLRAIHGDLEGRIIYFKVLRWLFRAVAKASKDECAH